MAVLCKNARSSLPLLCTFGYSLPRADCGLGTSHTPNLEKGSALSLASRPLVRLVVDVVGDVLDVVGAKLLTEGGHLAVALGDLCDDRLNAVLAVRDQRFLLDLLLGRDAIVATAVASRAIAREDTLPVLQVSRERRAASGHSGKKPQR